jgi:hypothetical protein
MEHLGGKKERRSQKDKRRSEKLKGKRTQEKKPKEPKNPYGKKKYDPEAEKQRKEKRKRDVEEGRAGLPGAGRAGRQPTKKQKEKSRKQKHKKRLYAAVAKVASQNPEFAKLLKAELKTADVDAVRGTAFNIARMLRGKLKEIPVERIPGYRSYYKGQPHLDPAASVMYLVRDVEADFEYEPMRGPMDDPQKDRTYEDSGVFNILFYPILNNQGVQGIEWQIGGEGEMPWSDLYDQDRRMRRWQDRDIAQEIKQSLEQNLESAFQYSMEHDEEYDYRYASGMRTAPLRTVVPPSFDSNQWRYFKGPAKTLARAWREKKDPPWHLVDRTIKIFEDYQYLREKPGWEDNEQTVSIMDALDKLRDYRDKLYPQGKPKKRKMSPGKILAEMMTDPAIVAMVRKLTPFFKRKPAEAAMFASEVLEDANFHSDNRLFNVAMADYDRDAVPLSYSDVAMKLRWDSRVLPFAAALLIAAGAKGAARSMLKKWGDNNKDWLLQNA